MIAGEALTDPPSYLKANLWPWLPTNARPCSNEPAHLRWRGRPTLMSAETRRSSANGLKSLPSPPGYRRPAVWICGDSHLGNLEPVADAYHHVDVQIRGLDQAVIANPVYDLIRLGLSRETAARSSDLLGITTARMIEAMVDGYCQALTPTVDDDPGEPDLVRSVRREAIGRRWRHLAKDRLEDVEPNIPHKRFWKLSRGQELDRCAVRR